MSSQKYGNVVHSRSMMKMKIEDIKHERIREILALEKLSDEDAIELTNELFKSTLITGCVDADGGTNFVLIWDSENKPHLPLFTDLDEFNKIFSNYGEDVYPAAYRFADLLSVAREDLVINPASESLKLDPEIFRNDG